MFTIREDEMSTAPIAHIDDDKSILLIAERAYKKTGLSNEWLSFSDPQEFIDYMILCKLGKKTTPEVIFLDINMPVLNGFDVLEKIKNLEEFSDVPIFFMLTSSHDVSDKEKALNGGAKQFITKPKGLPYYVELFKEIIESVKSAA